MKHWTPEEEKLVLSMRARGATYDDIGKKFGATAEQVRWLFRQGKLEYDTKRISESPFMAYDSPLTLDGDVLVLPDVELPFHDCDFLNAVIDLAVRSNIKYCVCAGDLVHFDSLSSYGPTWNDEPLFGQDAVIQKLIDEVPTELQATLVNILEKLSIDGDPSISGEMKAVRKAVMDIGGAFDEVHYVIGNHDSRILRALGSPLVPSELLRFIDAGPNWQIRPFYYSVINSGGRKFQVEHPRSASACTAKKLAVKYQCSTLVAHSHRLSLEFDPSGMHYAITMGCCVDERRLPYASQRHSNADAHRLGAVIVKDGYPYLLFEGCPLLYGKRTV